MYANTILKYQNVNLVFLVLFFGIKCNHSFVSHVTTPVYADLRVREHEHTFY